MSDSRWAWLELACTVAAPVLVLSFGTSTLGPTGALVVALVFPFGFALAAVAREGRPSALSAMSLASVVLTGGIGLLELPPAWFAVKEAAVPAAFGLGIAATAATRYDVVGVLLDRLIDPERLTAAVTRAEQRHALVRATRRGTIELGAVTALSGVASGLFAAWWVHAPPGTEAFTSELAAYTGWSFPAVTLPSMALSAVVLRRVLAGLEAAAGRPFDELLRER